MVENVKKSKRVRSFVFVGILLGLCIAAAVIWLLFFYKKSYRSEAVPHVDGTIETDASAVELAMQGFAESAPADLIRDQAGDTLRVGLVFLGLTEEADTNHAVLELLEQNDLRASFALSASEVLGDEDFLEQLQADGYDLLSNNASGESNLHQKAASEMVSTMYRSREAISTAADRAVPLLYCSSTLLTGDVLRAASVSGYEAVLDPQSSHVLDENSFDSAADAAAFVDGLQGDTIVVVDLRGPVESIQKEDAVTAEKPAIDKQAGLEESSTPEEEQDDILTKAAWLVQALKERGVQTAYVRDFQRTEGLTALREQVNDPDAELATVYRSCLTDQKQAGLAVKGLPAAEEMENALALLGERRYGVTFFVTPEEAAARGDDLVWLTDAGCSVGVTLPAAQLQGLSRTAVFDLLYDALRTTPDTDALVLLDEETSADAAEALRAAASLLGARVVQPESPAEMQAGALYLLDTLDSARLDALEQQSGEAGLQLADLAAVVRQSGVLPTLSLQELSALRKQNGTQKAEVQNMVYTTERAVSFAFYGMSRKAVVQDAVDCLRAHGGSGTFFVTLDELMNNSSAIEYVLSQGDEIGIYYKPTSAYPQTFDAVASYINSWKTYAAWRYGVDSDVVFITAELSSEEAAKAVSASGCQLVKNTFLVVKDEDRDMTAEDLPAAVERIASMRVMRGSFICFNMDFYTNDQNAVRGSSILGTVLGSFIENHVDTLAYHTPDTGEIEDASRFTITTVSHVLDSDQKYSFCTDAQTDVTMDKNVLTDMATDEERFQFIAQRYYGNVTVDAWNKLPGFSQSEIRQLDKAGCFTNDKVIFLTFDDWGTEQSINELLYVLEKHQVKATFFIRTGYVDANPNLLRTIAVQGHQIASHTDNHVPLADSVDERGNRMVSLTDEEALALRQDLVTSYDKLYRYVGDVSVDGKPALTRMFRPPTLAVSKIGLSQVFDVGFEYSISGAYSTGDYEASGYQDMLNRLKRRSIGEGKYVTVHNGTVLVMHMQENAKYTAQALDTMIPLWKEQGYTFARIDDYLGN